MAKLVIEERDCENCKNYKMNRRRIRIGDKALPACNPKKCKFEPKEKSGDGQKNTRNR